jgi:xeroderma pigmentosum group C-complementing protein
MPSNAEEDPLVHEDSEDELDWEEINVPEQQHLEITIQTAARPKEDAAVNKSVSFLMKRFVFF